MVSCLRKDSFVLFFFHSYLQFGRTIMKGTTLNFSGPCKSGDNSSGRGSKVAGDENCRSTFLMLAISPLEWRSFPPNKVLIALKYEACA